MHALGHRSDSHPGAVDRTHRSERHGLHRDRPGADLATPVRHHAAGERCIFSGGARRPDVALDRQQCRRAGHADLRRDRNDRCLRRRPRRRSAQPAHQHLPGSAGPSAAYRDQRIPPVPRRLGHGVPHRALDVVWGGTCASLIRPNAPKSGLRAGRQDKRRIVEPDHLRRDHAKHDQPYRRRLPGLVRRSNPFRGGTGISRIRGW